MSEVVNVNPRKRKRSTSESFSDQENIQPTKKLSDSDSDDEEAGYFSIVADVCVSRSALGSPFMTPHNVRPPRPPPIPVMRWVDYTEMWKVMIKDDEESALQRKDDVFARSSTLIPRMRVILLDWLSEVCEVYHLHKETYFLSVDYIDRYLSQKPDTPKQQLQLLGITCLFIAAKIEEIYPPKLNEFAYVTDGACSDENILTKELIILRELNWELTPMSINYWLCLYMQIFIRKTEERQFDDDNDEPNENIFVYPQYSAVDYETAARICNLSVWDVGIFKYSYAVVAASAVYYVYGRDIALAVSNISWKSLKPCIDWMYPFAVVVKETTDPIVTGIERGNVNCRTGLTTSIPNIIHDEAHIMQIHNVTLDMFDKARTLRPRTPCRESTNESPTKNVMLTPPKSGGKNGFKEINLDTI